MTNKKKVSEKERLRRDRQSQVDKKGYFVQGSHESGNFMIGTK